MFIENSDVRDDGSSEESDRIAKENGLVKVYRSTTSGGRTLSPRDGYQLSFSTRREVAMSYANDGKTVEVFYVNPRHFEEQTGRYGKGGWSKTDFDKRVSVDLVPSRVMGVDDAGPRWNEGHDPDKMFTHESDIYGTHTNAMINTPEDVLSGNIKEYKDAGKARDFRQGERDKRDKLQKMMDFNKLSMYVDDVLVSHPTKGRTNLDELRGSLGKEDTQAIISIGIFNKPVDELITDLENDLKTEPSEFEIEMFGQEELDATKEYKERHLQWLTNNKDRISFT